MRHTDNLLISEHFWKALMIVLKEMEAVVVCCCGIRCVKDDGIKKEGKG